MNTVRPNKIDLWFESNGGFREFKRTLLELTAAIFAKNQNVKVNTLIAIPYNPYEPAPYKRWAMR